MHRGRYPHEGKDREAWPWPWIKHAVTSHQQQCADNYSMMKSRMVTSNRVTLTYDPDWAALYWAKGNCASYINNDLHQDGYNTYDQRSIDYFFGDANDATWFALRWMGV